MNSSVEKISKYLSLIDESNRLINEANGLLRSGPKSFYFEKVQEYVTALFEKYAPFQDGDRVEISAEINTDNGWRSCAHFLIIGEKGTVREVDYRGGRFIAAVVMDRESWITTIGPDEGKINLMPDDDKHMFSLGEDKLTVIKY